MSMPTARHYDLCTGHGCYPPRPNSNASGDVFVNFRGCHRISDGWYNHCCEDKCHGGSTTSGSSTVFANGKKIARVGDSVSCGSNIMTGSHNVYTGG